MVNKPMGGKREGAGRKPKHQEEMVHVAARIPKSVVKDMDKEAHKRNISRNDVLIERCKK